MQIFANTLDLPSKYSPDKKVFSRFLALLTHQHHIVEYYLTVTKMALEIFQVITCPLELTYNVNVRHTESWIINTVVSLAVYKRFFD